MEITVAHFHCLHILYKEILHIVNDPPPPRLLLLIRPWRDQLHKLCHHLTVINFGQHNKGFNAGKRKTVEWKSLFSSLRPAEFHRNGLDGKQRPLMSHKWVMAIYANRSCTLHRFHCVLNKHFIFPMRSAGIGSLGLYYQSWPTAVIIT